MIEPRDPFKRLDFQLRDRLQASSPVDDFRLVESIEALGQRVAVAVAPAAHERHDAGLRQSFQMPPTADSGRPTENCRCIRSCGHGIAGSGCVVRTFLPRVTPRKPLARISRSTVQRTTHTP